MVQAGAKAVITARSKEPGRALATELRGLGGDVTFFRHDVTSETSWCVVLQQTEAAYGRLHILVNNAGAHVTGALENISLQDFDRTMAANVRGPLIGIKLALPLMRKTVQYGGAGAVVNVSSTAALRAQPEQNIYDASKGALQLLSRSLAKEFASSGYNIRVNCVNPGIIETEMTESFLREAVTEGTFASEEAARQELMRDYPIGRFAQPEDIARAIIFLASDDASYITGIGLPVDGGETA
jgi:3alpha(or 20beta)-hydroxysteroid dehydrogenase